MAGPFSSRQLARLRADFRPTDTPIAGSDLLDSYAPAASVADLNSQVLAIITELANVSAVAATALQPGDLPPVRTPTITQHTWDSIGEPGVVTITLDAVPFGEIVVFNDGAYISTGYTLTGDTLDFTGSVPADAVVTTVFYLV